MLKDAGCDVQGERVHFRAALPASCARRRRQATPSMRETCQVVEIGGNNMVFAPVYGPPFVRDLENERRYATIEDFRNFVKLVYMLPGFHHSGGTVCEPVDLRHQAASRDDLCPPALLRQALYGSVTAPDARRTRSTCRKSCLARISSTPIRDDQPDQRELADDLGRHHAWGAQGLCAQQPGLHHRASSSSPVRCRRSPSPARWRRLWPRR